MVHIGSVMGAMSVILTSALARFKKEHPKVRVSMQVDTSDMLIPALLRGDLDVVLGRLPDQFQGEELVIEAMEGEPMVVIARPGHPHFDKPKLKIKDLVTNTWILHPTGSPMRQRIEQALQEASLMPPPDIVETSSILATTALLESTDMISVTSLDVAQHYAHYGMLAILPVKLPMTMAKLGILSRKGREVSSAVKAFMQTLRESALERNLSKKNLDMSGQK
jgi:DNA-binding transcriptional LysR family regulator